MNSRMGPLNLSMNNKMGNYTKKQHFVQKALIENWAVNGNVNIARVDSDLILKPSHSKSPTAVFYELNYYEHVYNFESAEDHRKSGMITSTDANHIFKTNDGEQYCKGIEDLGFPVIREIINAANKGLAHIILSKKQKLDLCRYMVLQALRTPGGRANYQYDYFNQYISKEADNEDALKGYISNFEYLFMLGTYDKTGLSDRFEIPKSPFSHFVELFQDANGYVATIEDKDHNQFILGDNPCVFLGEKDSLWGMMMPISPKAMIVFLNEEEERDCVLTISKCRVEWHRFEIYSQIHSAVERIIYSSENIDLNDILVKYNEAKENLSRYQKIWNGKELFKIIG